DRFLGEDKPAYVPRDLPEPAEAIAWIRAARGLPVLAHPTWVRESAEGLSKLCERLKGAGLMGIEAHYSTHKPQQTADYLDTGRLLQAPRRLNLELFQVLADEFRHLEHRHLFLAAEYRLERVVSVDHASVLGVLQPSALNVLPDLLGHLGARQGFVADHLAE